MYIIKNARKGITRAKGRSILIGIIVLVISLSACISLSIQSASDQAAEDAMKNLKITAQIGIDREAMMQGKDSKEDKKEALEGAQDLTLEELQEYAEAESVSDFYYTASASLNGESMERWIQPELLIQIQLRQLHLTGRTRKECRDRADRWECSRVTRAAAEWEPREILRSQATAQILQ